MASALAGRKVVWSFEDTSSTRPKNGPPTPAAANHTTMSTSGTSSRTNRDGPDGEEDMPQDSPAAPGDPSRPWSVAGPPGADE
ncbi:hypothetical protein GCM10017782_10610 [Deinococcus ficus]|nr:hypothetical protein GCM10017782_10610 [Deinococcus ficus]